MNCAPHLDGVAQRSADEAQRRGSSKSHDTTSPFPNRPYEKWPFRIGEITFGTDVVLDFFEISVDIRYGRKSGPILERDHHNFF